MYFGSLSLQSVILLALLHTKLYGFEKVLLLSEVFEFGLFFDIALERHNLVCLELSIGRVLSLNLFLELVDFYTLYQYDPRRRQRG